MERSDLDEVNDLLDEWFRGEGTGKELPNRLQHIVQYFELYLANLALKGLSYEIDFENVE
jgi:hypothetical protein